MQYQFDTHIARLYGLPEAVLIHNIYFWVRRNEANEVNYHDGHYWTYNSTKALADIFSFWTPRQIQRIIKSCREQGLIVTAQHNENPSDRTLWYRVTETVKCIYANGEMGAAQAQQSEGENNEKSEEMQETETSLGDEEQTISPNGEMDCTERLNANHQTVKSIKGTDKKPDSKRGRGAPAPEKKIFGEMANVKLSEQEYDKILKRYGSAALHEKIEELSLYMASSGNTYEWHYATILKWLRKDKVPELKDRGESDEWW